MTTETFRAAAARRDRRPHACPVIADRLAVRAEQFGFDDVVLGAAASCLDQELGIR